MTDTRTQRPCLIPSSRCRLCLRAQAATLCHTRTALFLPYTPARSTVQHAAAHWRPSLKESPYSSFSETAFLHLLYILLITKGLLHRICSLTYAGSLLLLESWVLLFYNKINKTLRLVKPYAILRLFFYMNTRSFPVFTHVKKISLFPAISLSLHSSFQKETAHMLIYHFFFSRNYQNK